MKNKKLLLGILLIVVAILGLFGWEVWGRQQLTFDEVVVFKENLEQGDIVRKNNLKIKRVAEKNKESITKENVSKIVNKTAGQFIHSNTELYEEYFDYRGLSANKTNFIFSIPKEWILSVPQTLRRGDQAYLYSVSNEKNTKKYLTNAKVAYTKDNNSNEVKSNDKTRLNATSSISSVELVVNKVQANLLTSHFTKDTKLIIMYR
ncbi:MAG: hypothetical protein RSA49_04705 [Anaerovoracaceae bacterium]